MCLLYDLFACRLRGFDFVSSFVGCFPVVYFVADGCCVCLVLLFGLLDLCVWGWLWFVVFVSGCLVLVGLCLGLVWGFVGLWWFVVLVGCCVLGIWLVWVVGVDVVFGRLGIACVVVFSCCGLGRLRGLFIVFSIMLLIYACC